MSKVRNPIGGLSSQNMKVLRFLVSRYSEDFGFYPFRPIARKTKLSLAEVRRACRVLKRLGLAEFGSGLCNDDGGFVGSGYSATPGAVKLLPNVRGEHDE